MKVLVVEDDPSMGMILERILSARGHEVKLCRDGESAWAEYEADPPPLAFIDIGLPDISGLDVCRNIRSHAEGRWTVIVVATARGRARDVEEGLEAGADDYVVKPFGLDFLKHRVAIAENQARDRKARRVAEEALRAGRASFLDVVESLEDGIVVTSPSGLVKYRNSAAENMLGGEVASQLDSRAGFFVRPGETVDLLLMPQSCSDWRNLEMTVIETRWEGSSAFMGCIRDVTRLVELQKNLERSERLSALGTLVTGVAHEVRNPLFAISATVESLELMLGESDRRERVLQLLENLSGQVDRLANLMRDLTAYGRPSAAERTICSLSEIVEQAMTLCRPMAESADVVLTATFQENQCLVEVEKERIVQVVENLAANAISFSPPGAQVSIELNVSNEEKKSWVLCSVKDRGPGISPVDLPHIFEPFFTRRKQGTGLGLSVVEKFVSEHGGKISVDDNPEGGTVMTFRLPLKAE